MIRIGKWIFGLLLLLFSAAILLFPTGIEYGAKRWLLEQGELGTVVGLENVDFNPLTATLEVFNLDIAVDDEKQLRIPELKLSLSWGPLLRKQLTIHEIAIKGVKLLVKRPREDLMRIGGILLDLAAGEPRGDTADRSWDIYIRKISILNTEIRYREAERDTRLTINELELDRLISASPAQQAVLSFRGLLNEAPIEIEGYLLPFAIEPAFEGSINIEAFQVATLAGYLPSHLNKLEVALTIKSDLALQHTQNNALSLKQKGLIALDGIAFQSEAGQIIHKGLAWEGNLQLGLPLAKAHLEFSAEGSLDAAPMTFQGIKDHDPKVLQNAMKWTGRINYQMDDDKSAADLEGTLKLDQLKVELPDMPGHIQQEVLTWNGKMAFKQENGNSEIKLGGTLNAQGLVSKLEALSLEMASAETRDLDVTVRHSEEQGLSINQAGEIALQALLIDLEESTLEQADLTWHGETAVTKSPSGTLKIESKGALKSGPSALALKPQEMTVDYQEAEWNGALQLGMKDKLEAMVLNGGLKVGQLQVQASQQEYNLINIDRIQAEPIAAKDLEHYTIDKLDLYKLSIGQAKAGGARKEPEAEALLYADAFAARDIEYSPKGGLAIASLQPKDVQSLIYRDKDGHWNLDGLKAALGQDEANQLPAASKEGQEQAALTPQDDTSSPNENGLPIRIQEITFMGSNGMQFKDDKPTPPFKTSVALEQLSLTGLDSTKPNDLSPLKIEALVDKKAKLTFDGGIAPFAQDLTLELKGQIEGLPLPSLSSYTGQMLGYNLDSGELNADVSLGIKAGQVDGENQLAIHQLEVSPLSAEKMKELNTQLNMPLDTALGMLRDKNNTIKLKLPVKGPIDELQIDPSDAINQAVGKAIKAGAKTYLSAALFPFGTMLKVIQIAGEAANKVRLDPIFFEPASTALSTRDHEYLSKIAGILRERPEIHIKVCGRSVEADREALAARSKSTEKKGDTKPSPVTDEQLLSLAEQRASEIDEYLIKTHSINGSRLISCQPLIEKGPSEEKPRTELLI